MKLKFLTHVAFSLIFVAAITLLPGQTDFQKLAEPPYIEVNGTAEKEIIPDEIYITIVIRERYVNKTKVSIEEQEEKLKSALKSNGIDLANLTLSDANADYVKIHWKKKDVLTKKDYSLKVSSATQLGQVFLELEKLEITDAYIARVNHSKIESYRKEVKIEAIKAAKEKADYLLSAIGEQTGKPLIIKESEYFNNIQSNIRMMSGVKKSYYLNEDDKVSSEEKDEEIQFQKIKIQTSIYVKFSIK